MFIFENCIMWNFWNRIANTAAIAPRVWWTAVTAVSDLWNTYYTMGKESYEVVADTTQNVKNVLLWAWNHGKRYHKAANIPLSPVIATWAAVEWVVRSVVQPVVNGVVNTRNTWKNAIKNTRRSTFGRVFSKKPISDFSYDHMKTRWLKLNNRISKWQFGRWKSSKVKNTTNKVEKVQRDKIETAITEKPNSGLETPVTKNKSKETKAAVKSDEKQEKAPTESEWDPVAKKTTETAKPNADIAEALRESGTTAIATYLGLKETADMIKYKEDVIKFMKEWKEVKSSLIKYEDRARKIIDTHKWDDAIKANIALDLIKLDMATEWLKIKNDKRDKKYIDNLKKYQKENIKTAKMQAKQIWFKEINTIIEKIIQAKPNRA